MNVCPGTTENTVIGRVSKTVRPITVIGNLVHVLLIQLARSPLP